MTVTLAKQITHEFVRDYNRQMGSVTQLVAQAEYEDQLIIEDAESEESVDPVYFEIPESAKLFRVLLERSLGIDWERTPPSSLENESLQTN